MTTPNYFVQSSIARDDTATFADREDGSQPLAVTLTREDDGATDARHPVTLTIDLDVTDDAHVVVNQNGTQLYALDLGELSELLEQIDEERGDWRGAVVTAYDIVEGARRG